MLNGIRARTGDNGTFNFSVTAESFATVFINTSFVISKVVILRIERRNVCRFQVIGLEYKLAPIFFGSGVTTAVTVFRQGIELIEAYIQVAIDSILD